MYFYCIKREIALFVRALLVGILSLGIDSCQYHCVNVIKNRPAGFECEPGRLGKWGENSC